MRPPLLLLASYFLLWPLGLAAQEDNEKRKVFQDRHVWTDQPQLRYYFKPETYVFFQQHLRINAERPFSDWVGYRLGLEHRFNQHWAFFTNTRYAFNPQRDTWFERLQLRHRGQILGIRFFKSVGIDYQRILPENGEPEARFRPRAKVRIAKAFPWGTISFSPFVSYEVFRFVKLGNAAREPDMRRFLDMTRMRAGFHWNVHPRIRLKTYWMRETRYSVILKTFDEPPTINTPETKIDLNRVMTVFYVGAAIKLGQPEAEQ